MTYNIHRWAGADQRLDIDRLAWVIRAAGADVVALNEVLHPVTAGPRVYAATGRVGQMPGTDLCLWAERLDRLRSWLARGGGQRVTQQVSSSGCEQPLVAASHGHKTTLTSRGRALRRAGDWGCKVYVTHLDHAWEGTRLRQIEGALAIIGETGKPHFLVGDFNTPGFLGSCSRRLLPPVLRRLRRAGYQDAFFAVGTGNGRTFPAKAPLVRFDFLFLPNCWAGGLRSASIVDHSTIGHASDHRPVVIEWSWPATRGG